MCFMFSSQKFQNMNLGCGWKTSRFYWVWKFILDFGTSSNSAQGPLSNFFRSSQLHLTHYDKWTKFITSERTPLICWWRPWDVFESSSNIYLSKVELESRFMCQTPISIFALHCGTMCVHQYMLAFVNLLHTFNCSLRLYTLTSGTNTSSLV